MTTMKQPLALTALALFAGTLSACEAPARAEPSAPEAPAAPEGPALLADAPPADGDSDGEEAKSDDSAEEQRDGKIIIANPGKVCREAGGTFGSSFDVLDLGEAHLQVITSVKLNTKLVKTGDQLKVKIIRNRKVLGRAELQKRTTGFVVTEKGFSHIPLFSEETVKVKVFPGEVVSVQDPAIRNFGKKACVKLRPERLPPE